MTKDMTTQQLDSVPIKESDKLIQLKDAVRLASKGLNIRQRKFAETLAIGNQTYSACARTAGYGGKSVNSRASALAANKNIQLLVEKHAALNAYQYGHNVQHYHDKLDTLLAMAMEDRNINAANSVIRTFAELSGFLNSKGKGGASTVTVNIIGLDRTGVTIEHES